jgi:hypothetical protein
MGTYIQDLARDLMDRPEFIQLLTPPEEVEVIKSIDMSEELGIHLSGALIFRYAVTDSEPVVEVKRTLTNGLEQAVQIYYRRVSTALFNQLITVSAWFQVKSEYIWNLILENAPVE